MLRIFPATSARWENFRKKKVKLTVINAVRESMPTKMKRSSAKIAPLDFIRRQARRLAPKSAMIVRLENLPS